MAGSYIFPWWLIAAETVDSTGVQVTQSPLWFTLTIVLVLLFINGFFVALEFSLVGLRKTRIEELVRQGVRGAAAVKRGKENVDDFVAAGQLGITVASLALGMVVEPTAASHLRPVFLELGITDPKWIHGISGILGVGIVTVFHVWLGEQVPKIVAIYEPARVALFTVPTTELFLRICRPVIRGLSSVTALTLRPFGIDVEGLGHRDRPHTEEEIRNILVLRQQAGLSEEEETEMITRVFDFFDMVATQVMVPRTEMVCLPLQATVRDAIELSAREGHERYPIYNGDLDNIVGVLLIKDILSVLSEGEESFEAPITGFMREVLKVPACLPVAKLMSQMRGHHTRLAIVLDEYGGTAGMVTVGDFWQRILGEVEEVDQEGDEEDFLELGNGRFLISGLLLAKEVEDYFDMAGKLRDEYNDTIGGVVFSKLGRKPEIGDQVEISGLKFIVKTLDGNRIDRLLVDTAGIREVKPEIKGQVVS